MLGDSKSAQPSKLEWMVRHWFTAILIHSFIQQMPIGSLLGGRHFASPGDTAQNKTMSLCSKGLDSASRAQGGSGLRVRTRGYESREGEGGKGRSQVRPSRRNKNGQEPDPAPRAHLQKRKARKAEPRKLS